MKKKNKKVISIVTVAVIIAVGLAVLTEHYEIDIFRSWAGEMWPDTPF